MNKHHCSMSCRAVPLARSFLTCSYINININMLCVCTCICIHTRDRGFEKNPTHNKAPRYGYMAKTKKKKKGEKNLLGVFRVCLFVCLHSEAFRGPRGRGWLGEVMMDAYECKSRSPSFPPFRFVSPDFGGCDTSSWPGEWWEGGGFDWKWC